METHEIFSFSITYNFPNIKFVHLCQYQLNNSANMHIHDQLS